MSELIVYETDVDVVCPHCGDELIYRGGTLQRLSKWLAVHSWCDVTAQTPRGDVNHD